MMNTQIFDIVHTASVAKPYQSNPNRSASAAAVHTDSGKYDSVSISAQAGGKNRFQQELVSRLSNEIRTANSTGRIQELRQAVSSGSYHPDPSRIAGQLLFQLEG